jgi:ADP-heptose:LPS heptosyltransferase
MIIIQPFSRKLRNGKENPKNPGIKWWKEVISVIPYNHKIVQIGQGDEEKLVEDYHFDLSLKHLKELTLSCDTWIGIDSFYQHLAWSIGKKGIVIFGQSDPNIFGHKENINLLNSRAYLRQWQFQTWEEIDHKKESFVTPKEVINNLITLLN